MVGKRKQILALGGGGFSMEPENPLLDDALLALSASSRPRICFVPTASGDSADYTSRFYGAFARRAEATHLELFRRKVRDVDSFLAEQDIVFVGGGNTASMLAVWRAHGVDRALRGAYENGTVLSGVSAGAICWFEGGVTDSFGPELLPLTNGLGFLSGSFCPHYDGEVRRRPTYHAHVGRALADGWAADDGAALHFIEGSPTQMIRSREHAMAYRVSRIGEEVSEVAWSAASR